MNGSRYRRQYQNEGPPLGDSPVDYKNIEQVRRYTSERGKIRSRRMSGACRRHQRQVAVAVKRAREMALLPYVAEGGPPPTRSRSSERR